MKRFVLTFICLHITFFLTGQEIARDTLLQEVVVQAFSSERAVSFVPASIGFLDNVDFNRFNNVSIVPVFNTIPGVRMEERSPGSYRFSIRGSSIRSPFGVRNVKVYLNGLPFTDAGGNTYLNLLDPDNVGTVEILKGPSGSVYGAGTGGVLLFGSPRVNGDQLGFSSTFGSYGLERYAISGRSAGEKINVLASLSHQKVDNYRDQSAMERTVFHGRTLVPLDPKDFITADIFYSRLFYETPGGLTKAQFSEDPSQARPSTPTIAGAKEQNASVSNNTIFSGLSHDRQWTPSTSSVTGFYYAVADFENPAIRNFEVRKEKNIGVRSVTKNIYTTKNLENSLSGGLEFQHMTSDIDVFRNLGGAKGDLFTRDKLTADVLFLFVQNEIEIANRFLITTGLSANFSKTDFRRKFPEDVKASRKFDPVLLPRLALLYRLSKTVSAYGSFSRGYSPPTIAELYPSRNIFDKDLDPEKGTNIELGLKQIAASQKFSFDLTSYIFGLDRTIVIRRDPSIAGEPEYFVNAGETLQKGVEAMVKWTPVSNDNGFVSEWKITGSYSYNDYEFVDYVQGTDSYSGNMMTGVAPVTVFAGTDLFVLNKYSLKVTGNYVDHIPLNDANTEFANEYFLLGARAGMYQRIRAHRLELFMGVDNALDRAYSLGNDLNAAGGRYYNAAAPRNYYFGVRLDLSLKK